MSDVIHWLKAKYDTHMRHTVPSLVIFTNTNQVDPIRELYDISDLVTWSRVKSNLIQSEKLQGLLTTTKYDVKCINQEHLDEWVEIIPGTDGSDSEESSSSDESSTWFHKNIISALIKVFFKLTKWLSNFNSKMIKETTTMTTNLTKIKLPDEKPVIIFNNRGVVSTYTNNIKLMEEKHGEMVIDDIVDWVIDSRLNDADVVIIRWQLVESNIKQLIQLHTNS